MITVAIAGMAVPLDSASDAWINQMLEGARRRGTPICVRVQVMTDSVNIALATPGCGPGVGGQAPNDRERRIIDLWNQKGLGGGNVHPGELRSFLDELSRLI